MSRESSKSSHLHCNFPASCFQASREVSGTQPGSRRWARSAAFRRSRLSRGRWQVGRPGPRLPFLRGRWLLTTPSASYSVTLILEGQRAGGVQSCTEVRFESVPMRNSALANGGYFECIVACEELQVAPVYLSVNTSDKAAAISSTPDRSESAEVPTHPSFRLSWPGGISRRTWTPHVWFGDQPGGFVNAAPSVRVYLGPLPFSTQAALPAEFTIGIATAPPTAICIEPSQSSGFRRKTLQRMIWLNRRDAPRVGEPGASFTSPVS